MDPTLCVTPEQRTVHVATEAIAVFALAPFMAYLATRRRPLTDVERTGLWVMVGGTLLVDGVLLYRWVTRPR